MFLVDKEVEASDYHELFVVYKESFMFEVEKIMVMNECAASIIYASSKSEFLNISKPTLASFLTQ